MNETALVFNVFCTAEGTNAFKLYEECENIGGNYVIRISIFFVSQTAIGVHIFAWLYAIFNIFEGNLHPETYFIPYHADLPFDISTYPGYIGSTFVRAAAGINDSIILVAIIGFHISCCLYIEAFCEHFKIKAKFIDEKFKEAKTKADFEFIQNLFQDAIDFHMKIIE